MPRLRTMHKRRRRIRELAGYMARRSVLKDFGRRLVDVIEAAGGFAAVMGELRRRSMKINAAMLSGLPTTRRLTSYGPNDILDHDIIEDILRADIIGDDE